MNESLAGWLTPRICACTAHGFSSSRFVLHCSHSLAGQLGESHWHEAESVAVEHVVGYPEVGVLYCVATPNTRSFV